MRSMVKHRLRVHDGLGLRRPLLAPLRPPCAYAYAYVFLNAQASPFVCTLAYSSP